MGSSVSSLRKLRHRGKRIHCNLVNLNEVPNLATYQRKTHGSRKHSGKNKQVKNEIEVLSSIEEEFEESDNKKINKKEPHQPHHPHRSHRPHKRNNNHNHYINSEFHYNT